MPESQLCSTLKGKRRRRIRKKVMKELIVKMAMPRCPDFTWSLKTTTSTSFVPTSIRPGTCTVLTKRVSLTLTVCWDLGATVLARV